MPGSKRYTRIAKLAAVLTARTSSVEEAATALDVDPRTVSAWVRTVELPAEGDPAAHEVYRAMRDHLLARSAVMTARSETRGLVQVMTASGIAGRNVAYTRPPAPSEEAVAVPDTERRRQMWDVRMIPVTDHDADYRRQHYIRAGTQCLRDHLRERGDSLDPDPETTGNAELLSAAVYYILRRWVDVNPDPSPSLLAWAEQSEALPQFAGLDTRSMDDDAYRSFLTDLEVAVQAAADAWWPSYCEAQRAIYSADRDASGRLTLYRNGQLTRQGGTLPPELEGLPIMVREIPVEALEVTPEPTERPALRSRAVPPPPEPASMLLDTGPDTWQPLERRDW